MPFDVQNDFISKAAGVDDEMFTDIPVYKSNFTYSNLNITNDDELGDTANEVKYELTNPANLTLIPKMEFTIKPGEGDKYVFLYVDAGNSKRVKYKVSGLYTDDQDRELSAGKSLFDIGKVSEDGEITVTLELTNKGEFEKTYRKSGTVRIYAASYNDEAFQKAYDKLSETPYNITEFTDTKITGEVDAAEDGLMFTSIPYNKGWSVTVDGEKQELVSIGEEGLVGVDVPKGKHEVVFKFSPQGFYLGCGVSAVSLAAAVIVTLFIFKKKKDTVEETAVEKE
jgi:uncharacterized membrane protein YfhO